MTTLKRCFSVTDEVLDAPDGAIVSGYKRVGDQWVPHGCDAELCSLTLTMPVGSGLELC